MVNARRRRRRRARRRNPFAMNDPARRRRRHGRRRNPFLANRRRVGRRRRSYRRNTPLRAPRTLAGLFSPAFLTDVAWAAAGAVTPSLVTDRLLPMIGMGAFITGPWVRRAVQFAVPTVVLMFARPMLGRGADAFATGAYAVTAVGLLNDLTGGIATLSAYEPSAPVTGMGRYELAAPGIGQESMDEAETLYAE